jgi:hypothetical protein
LYVTIKLAFVQPRVLLLARLLIAQLVFQVAVLLTKKRLFLFLRLQQVIFFTLFMLWSE